MDMCKLKMPQTTSARLSLLILLISNTIILNHAALTEEQMMTTAASLRKMCQPKFKVEDDIVNAIQRGEFAEVKELKCYVNCVLELMQVSKKGKLNYDSAIKQINSMLPENLREDYITGLTTCKEAAKGIKDNCEASFALLKCFYNANPKFIFP